MDNLVVTFSFFIQHIKKYFNAQQVETSVYGKAMRLWLSPLSIQPIFLYDVHIINIKRRDFSVEKLYLCGEVSTD